MAYINRELLIESLGKSSIIDKITYSDGMTIKEKIMKLPAADVVEVKWIDVNEWLPQKNVRVLVYLKENACDYTRIDTDRRIYNGQWIRWGNNVTHWMPLPEPPNGAKMDGRRDT